MPHRSRDHHDDNEDDDDDDDDDNEPIQDRTAAIPLHSKRTERMQRKQATREKRRAAIINLAKLPTELILQVLKSLRPSHVFNLALVNRRFHALVKANATVIGDHILKQRYPTLTHCFPLPMLLSNIDIPTAALLSAPARQKYLSIHHKPYSHVQPPNPQHLCTCLTCVMAWNNYNLVLDFAHWQDSLDNGVPIPMLPRGQPMVWNESLLSQNARLSERAVANSLWRAHIMETHLNSTVRSIRRHALNKGNKRIHVEMSDDEAASGTDQFLEKKGPLGIEFPFHRDNYYLLCVGSFFENHQAFANFSYSEAYLPNRYWKRDEQKWVFIPWGHERDLSYVVQSANRAVFEVSAGASSQCAVTGPTTNPLLTSNPY
ncbi:hypothetical protein K504DRAFT_51905 [Pleomassaria siparia CBS 279.74]|uniref:F-box domain-containing protein n=1 Tax=Pleomassaria siparia CBS 279.74 TaxID=1314801 RepID=A0A6G1K2U0_9PLEO|nr:hypothetical protein K504DRAFT_51905 [Pleomassaria siparia CBS 279.74]